jgi:S-adenosylmethionine decarboxylase
MSEALPDPSDSDQTRPIGRHLVADLGGFSPMSLRDRVGMMGRLEECLRREGYCILDMISHGFREGGCGFSGVILLAESHASLHSYPERGYLAFDLFSCGERDPRRALDAFLQATGGEIIALHDLPRKA